MKSIAEHEIPYITLIVPVLREQSTLAEMLSHFSKLDYPAGRLRVVVVTTERELAERARDMSRVEDVSRLVQEGVPPEQIAARYPGLGPPSRITPILRKQLARDPTSLREAIAMEPSTWESVETLVETLNASLGEPVFRRIHYPFTRGLMAHQVNYAVRYLFEVVDEGIDPSRLYVGLYNADSRPELDSLRLLAHMHYEDPEGTIAVQQYSSYRLAGSPAGVEGSFVLHAAALWQTRWTLAVELERARRTESLLAPPPRGPAPHWKRLLLTPFNYAIGHGLFVRLRELVLYNYLPETTSNEDAPFGYFLLLAGIRLRPLSRLDNCEVPRSVRSLLAQQAGWFRGPLQARTYLDMARRRRLTERAGVLLSNLLAWRVARDAVVWLLGPLLTAGGLAASVAVGGAPRAVFLSALLAYLVLPTIPACLVHRRGRDYPIRRPSPWRGLSGMPLFYLLHGAGPLHGMVTWAWDAARGIRSSKYKTER